MAAATTLLAWAGTTGTPVLSEVARVAVNVSARAVGSRPGGVVARHQADLAAWRGAGGSTIYTLVDGDPLAVVVEEWGRRLAGEPDDLEVAIGLVAASTPVPDYYLVDVALGPPVVDWYLDLVRRRAPSRVVPVEAAAPAVLDILRRLPRGPGLGDPRDLAASARDYVPLPSPGVREGSGEGTPG